MSFATALATLPTAAVLETGSTWAIPFLAVGVLGLLGTAVCLFLYWKAGRQPTAFAIMAERRANERANERKRYDVGRNPRPTQEGMTTLGEVMDRETAEEDP
jgi:hypothetical protein